MNKRNMFFSVSCILALFLSGMPAFAEGVSPGLIDKVYARTEPALCLIEYSSNMVNPNTGQATKRDGTALGVLVSADGLLVTHGHFLREDVEPFNIKVKVGRGENTKSFGVTLLQKPKDINLIFMRIQTEAPMAFPFVKFDKTPLELGEPLILFGILGESLDFNAAVLDTRVSSVLDAPRTTYCLNAGIPFGFVTAPAMDSRGNLVGLVGFDLSVQEGGEVYTHSGNPLLYQSELFSKYITAPPGEHSEESGENDAWVGILTQPLNEDFAAYWKLDRVGGLIISTVLGDSPAHKAGLQPGDVIISFNGTPIRVTQDRDVAVFTKLVRDAGPGKTVEITFLRNGESITREITLEARPRTSDDAVEYEDKTFGLTVREITTDVRIRLNLAEDVAGVIVRRVENGGTAQLAKMQPGVIILALGGKPVTSVEEYKAALEAVIAAKPAEVPVFARVGTVTGFFRLSPRWDAEQK